MNNNTNAVRGTKQTISNVHAIVGGVLFGVGALVFAIHFFVNHHAAVLALSITGGALAFSGMIELIICAVFRRAARRDQAKLARLKSEGQRFPGEIKRLHRHLGVTFARSFSVYAECAYENHERVPCLAKSPSFLHETDTFPNFSYHTAPLNDSIDRYTAWVYVNHRDPQDYAVEILA